MKNIRNKVLSGLVWTYSERIFAQLVSLFVSIILARLISPEEYGIISLVLIFITIADVIVSDGFGNALVQKKDSDDIDFSSMLYFSLACSIVLYLLIFLGAPFIAQYYEAQVLTKVTRVLALRIPVAAINSIQQAYISKKMEFKKFFYATLVGTVTSGIVGIIMALKGYGVWALVAQYLINSCMGTILLAIIINWRPKLIFSWKRVKSLLNYGFQVLSVSLLITIYSNLRSLIIGKKYSVEDLSYTNKGQQFPSLISVNINTSISKVIFPAIVEVQDDKKRVKAMTRRAIKVGTFLLAPALVGLSAVAPTFVSVILTDRWLPCVPYLRIMCLVYLLQPIQTASLQAMKALGEGALYLKLEIVKWCMGLGILGIFLLMFDDVYSVVFSALIVEIIATFINCRPNKKLLDYKYFEQIQDVIKPSISCIIMYFTVVFFNYFEINKILLLVIEIIVGMGSYILSSYILRTDSLFYILDILKTLKKPNR